MDTGSCKKKLHEPYKWDGLRLETLVSAIRKNHRIEIVLRFKENLRGIKGRISDPAPRGDHKNQKRGRDVQRPAKSNRGRPG